MSIWWKILGVAPTTDTKRIKKAYIKLIKQYHPEDHPDKFQDIRTAYENALRWAVDHSERNASSAAENSGDGPVASTEDRNAIFVNNRSMRTETITEPADLPNNCGHLFPKEEELLPLIRTKLSYYKLPDEDILKTVDKGIETTFLSIQLTQIDEHLSAGRQREAVVIFQQTVSKLDTLTKRKCFEERLYGMLSDYQVLPMTFIEHVYSYFGWDHHTDILFGACLGESSSLCEKYSTIQNLRRAVTQQRQGRLKTLCKKPNTLLITLSAFGKERRKSIQQWIEVLKPYDAYFGYLGIHPKAVSAWGWELKRPQFPNNENDTLFSLFTSLPYALFASAALPWPLWSKLCVGLLFWFIFCIFSMLMPVFRWAGFKWREDWRLRFPGNTGKAISDMIPIGIMMFFCLMGLYVFKGVNNAGTYGLFSFFIFLTGVRSFIWLGLLSMMLIRVCSGSNTELSTILILFIVFTFWLKIKLTIADLWTISDTASRRISLSVVMVLAWAAVYYEWHLPV